MDDQPSSIVASACIPTESLIVHVHTYIIVDMAGLTSSIVCCPVTPGNVLLLDNQQLTTKR